MLSSHFQGLSNIQDKNIVSGFSMKKDAQCERSISLEEQLLYLCLHSLTATDKTIHSAFTHIVEPTLLSDCYRENEFHFLAKLFHLFEEQTVQRRKKSLIRVATIEKQNSSDFILCNIVSHSGIYKSQQL